jgi:hypothetical protein
MWNDTDATLTNLTDTYEQIGLAQGDIRVRVFGLNPGSTAIGRELLGFIWAIGIKAEAASTQQMAA